MVPGIGAGRVTGAIHRPDAPAAVAAPSRDEWAAFVATHPDATPFHDPRWVEAISAATGHEAVVLATRDAQGALTGVLPLHHVRSPLFGAALAGSAFAVDGGILANDAASLSALATAAANAATQRGCGVELRGGPVPDAAGWTAVTGAHLGFVRDLPDAADAILTAIPRKQRAEVRKSLDGSLTSRVGTDAADRAAHYATYATSVRNLGTPVFPRALFDAVLDAFGPDADILTVFDGDAPVSSVLSLYWRGTVLPYWGGGTADARRNRANERMYYDLMLHAHARGCRRFDFGRSKVGSGPAAYKKNWGFEGQPLTYAAWTADGAPPRDVNPNSARYRFQIAAWQRLPLWVANRIGPWIARGLG